MVKGRIHSFQSLGAADGPGIRCVVFFQGCPLRCIYCHNPDTWDFKLGEEKSAEEVLQKIVRFKPFFGKDGGVTLSGGEVLMQPDFASELLRLCKLNGIHTAIDTSGICDLKSAEQVLQYTDLVICDIKFLNNDDYKNYCNADFNRVIDFLNLCEKMKIPFWIRSVIVPGINDNKAFVCSLINKVKEYSFLTRIELLPFKKLCITKYEALGIEFKLKNVPECSEQKIEELTSLIPGFLTK